MIEHNNRAKAKALAEFITGQRLRKYLADKVHQYAGEQVSVFDGACGSGQLIQHIKSSHLTAVEIQSESVKALAHNYPNADIHHMSFFDFMPDDLSVDCVVMNPPFSLKFKDLSDGEQVNIQSQFGWKKSGVVDDIFVLKAMEYSKRWGFFILSCGLGYRGTEKKFRELIGNQAVEISRIANAFDDTSIDVMFLVLDKIKTTPEYYSELLDCKTGESHTATFAIDADKWDMAQAPVPDKFGADFDIHALNQELVNQTLKHLDVSLEQHRQMAFLTGIDIVKVCDDAIAIANKHKRLSCTTTTL